MLKLKTSARTLPAQADHELPVFDHNCHTTASPHMYMAATNS